jgi:hypothetical protein
MSPNHSLNELMITDELCPSSRFGMSKDRHGCCENANVHILFLGCIRRIKLGVFLMFGNGCSLKYSLLINILK